MDFVACSQSFPTCDNANNRVNLPLYVDMMETTMIQDAQGHSLSGATAEAVALYDQAVRAFNLVHGDAAACSTRRARRRPTSRWHIWGRPGCSHWPMILAYSVRPRALVESAPALDVERTRAGPSRRAVPCGGGRADCRGRGARPAPDALPVRPCGASGRGVDRRVPRALPLGARPVGAGLAALVQGYAGLRHLARVPRLRAGGSRRLCARRGRVARGGRTRTA